MCYEAMTRNYGQILRTLKPRMLSETNPDSLQSSFFKVPDIPLRRDTHGTLHGHLASCSSAWIAPSGPLGRSCVTTLGPGCFSEPLLQRGPANCTWGVRCSYVPGMPKCDRWGNGGELDRFRLWIRQPSGLLARNTNLLSAEARSDGSTPTVNTQAWVSFVVDVLVQYRKGLRVYRSGWCRLGRILGGGSSAERFDLRESQLIPVAVGW